MNHFTVLLKLKLYCKSTILQKPKKKILFYINSVSNEDIQRYSVSTLKKYELSWER